MNGVTNEKDRTGPVIDGLDVWWVCTKPNCTAFFDNHKARDEHAATCPGHPEIPF